MNAKVRCAIYTRKSTEEGLEQDFNSLDAQREACEAYIRSQRGLGWVSLAATYDDGGISGGTMDRPALKKLLADIEARRVDLVVVYKVDRLTRSLADFGKIVEVFDAHGASFVSVTQQFNTTTSMGRLTLNMLLSFAQFEREVTGERIRDKIAASKKKGMWMGGPPPLGYDVRERMLVVIEEEAKTVRTLFRLYLELGTVKKLLAEANQRRFVTKLRPQAGGTTVGGQPFTRGHLHQLLRNPLYAGKVAHNGELYPGQHQAIIDAETFDETGRRLDAHAAERRLATNAKAPSLLTGLAWDETGDRLCPTHANKEGRRYRYYISKRLMHRNDATEGGLRLPAKELDGAVLTAVSEFLRDEVRFVDALELGEVDPTRLERVLARGAEIADRLHDRQLLLSLIGRVNVRPGTITISMKHQGLRDAVGEVAPCLTECSGDPFELEFPMAIKRRGVERRLVLGGAAEAPPTPDSNLIGLVAKAHLWWDQLSTGRVRSVGAIAAGERLHASDVGRVLPLAFLAPDIVEAICAGRHPTELTARRLKRIGKMPLDWERQRQILGFDAPQKRTLNPTSIGSSGSPSAASENSRPFGP
jgi:DNA invertase Pin-like site-specific DNA recombinase